MAEVMNRAARRAAGIHKLRKPDAKWPRGNAAAPWLYPEIPAIEPGHDFYPLKAFAVDVELVPALGPRLFLDRTKAARGTINCLDGPADTDPFRIHLPLDKLREFLAREETRRREMPMVLDDPGIPPGFRFGLLNIVTYPFRFMLTYRVKPDAKEDSGDLAARHWQVNSNLLNVFYPDLRRIGSVLSIPHFDEDPIDDAPVHNIVMLRGGEEDAEAFRGNLRLLLHSGVPTHYVCRSRPLMDDRYALHERRPEDGEPFNLLPLLEMVRPAAERQGRPVPES